MNASYFAVLTARDAQEKGSSCKTLNSPSLQYCNCHKYILYLQSMRCEVLLYFQIYLSEQLLDIFHLKNGNRYPRIQLVSEYFSLLAQFSICYENSSALELYLSHHPDLMLSNSTLLSFSPVTIILE